ncbi:MAG TPA: alpha/beta hydrolase [Pseudomonadota bacterium]|nr:alpha/beta hydrolase [Pseudomonadota bacterium]
MESLAAPDMELEYADPAMLHELRRHLPSWTRDAAAYREAAGARAQLEVVYGERPRQRLDLFAPTSGASGPVVLFIHGGYWQAMDKSLFSHLAAGPSAHGVTVAVAGYTLCPQVTVAQIVDELRQAVAFLARRFGRAITVCGHSAGGHLTACMVATDWRAVDAGLAADTVAAGLPISGLFELEPLIQTSLNERLGLDAAEARRLSPLLWPVRAGTELVAYVGASESAEYRRQTRALVARWRQAGVAASAVEATGENHFTVIAPLADPQSQLTQQLVRLAAP